MNQNITITLKSRDLIQRVNDYAETMKKYPRVPFSMSGLLIDELAYSAGQWTEDELNENNMDYESESVHYLLKEWKNGNAEDQFIHWLETAKNEPRDKNYKKSRLMFGAWLALHWPKSFETRLNDYIERVDSAFWDDDELEELAPELRADKTKAAESFWQNLTHEWLWGDRNGRGVVAEIGRVYGAEDTEYDHKRGDVFSFEYDPETLHGRYCGCVEDAEKCKEKMNYKHELINEIYAAANSRRAKDEAEQEKRHTENKRTAEYKKQRAEESKAEREAKLKSMKRK